MEQLVMRKTDESDDCIELDLNKPWPQQRARYSSYMDDVERLSTRRLPARKEFITLIH